MTGLARDEFGIHIEQHGSGAAILLTHGFGATCRMWDEQIEEFTDRYRLILWDLPGHGQSAPPTEGTTAEQMTARMLGILDVAEADRAVLIGLGLGGALSLRFFRAHPDRVRAMVLIGTMPGLRSDVARGIWLGQVEQLVASLRRDGLDALDGGAEVDPQLHASADGMARAADALLPNRDAGALPWLATIDVPVLILVGSEDKPNLTAAEYMARAIPGARRLVVPRANHAANIHKPDAVNAAIRDFLERLPK